MKQTQPPELIWTYAAAFLMTTLFLTLGERVMSAQPVNSVPVLDDCGSAEQNVNAVASALGICDDLKELLHPSRQSAYQEHEEPRQFFSAPGTPRPGALLGFPGRRQRVEESVNQGGIESNLMQLRVDNAKLQIENSLLVAEPQAFRRSKILNAWLGTGMQGIGTGLQLSKDVSVQRAGNILGVAGGAATIIFAFCTAELDPPPPAKSALALANAIAHANDKRLIPNAVWHYMGKDSVFLSSMQKALPEPVPQLKKKKFLSCRYTKLEDTELGDVMNRLTAIEKKIDAMTDGLSSMLKTLDQTH